ncbi:MAG: Glycosyltransferase [Rhodobacteraceae bacterium HLUCCA12]|nr:MAG: Glycosyltransferase [Rhodobacteraceae bacterium HLUCCA12]
MTKPRVLVIAEAANPEWVSVPLIGWSLSQALREVADVHLVTQIRNRDAILRAGLREGVDFTAIDSEALARPMWRLAGVLRMGEGRGWTMVSAISTLIYPHFERLVWRRFGAAITAGDYDLVHRITPLSPTTPSRLATWCKRAGVPFVLGPLNGGVPWPPGFDAARRQEREWLSYVRGLYKALPGRNRTLRDAAAIIVASRHTESEIPAQYAGKRHYIPENAIDPARFSRRATPSGGPLRACFIGRMVPYKGPDMLIEAAAPLLGDGRMVLDMIGDGPMLADLREQAKALGVANSVTFHGWLAHEQVQHVAARSALFAFPSVREFGGGAVLEAMALGLAPLIVDYAGPGELVGAGLGYKIALGTRDEIVARLRAALDRLERDRPALAETGTRARAHVLEHFTWPAKARQIAAVYEQVLARGGA